MPPETWTPKTAREAPTPRSEHRATAPEHRVDAGTIIDALLRNGPLKAGLDREGAVDILWILASADNFQRLVRARAWSLQCYEHWLAQTLLDQLLRANHQHPQEARAPRWSAP